MKKPKSLFRDRPRQIDTPDRRRVDYPELPATSEPVDITEGLDLSKNVVFMPITSHVCSDTQYEIDRLRDMGVLVAKWKGSSAIDLARNEMASLAVVSDLESFLFIDHDVKFLAENAVSLFKSDKSVIAGVYVAKSVGATGRFNTDWLSYAEPIMCGKHVGRVYPVRKTAAGFMRIKVDFLKRMIRESQLPYCRMGAGFGWPFFGPLLVDEGHGLTYLPEDYAFCHRVCQLGETPFVDTRFRLGHIGDYEFRWEEGCRMQIPKSDNMEITMEPQVFAPFVEPAI